MGPVSHMVRFGWAELAHPVSPAAADDNAWPIGRRAAHRPPAYPEGSSTQIDA
jgi:hypothetical protein